MRHWKAFGYIVHLAIDMSTYIFGLWTDPQTLKE